MMGWGGGFNTEQAGMGAASPYIGFGMNIDRRRWIPNIDRLSPTSFFFSSLHLPSSSWGTWAGLVRAATRNPLFVFSHQCILNKERFLACKGRGRLPLRTKSLKIYAVPAIIHCIALPLFHCQAIFRRRRSKIRRQNLVSSGTAAYTGKQLTSNPLHTNNTPSRPAHTHISPPYPTMSQESGNTSAPQVPSCTTYRSHNTILPGGLAGWRGLASEVGSGVGGPKGSCLGLTGGCWSLNLAMSGSCRVGAGLGMSEVKEGRKPRHDSHHHHWD